MSWQNYIIQPLQVLKIFLPYGHRLLEEGAQHVIISMVGDGALLFHNRRCLSFQRFKTSTEKNSVGAGDSMIAGFIGNFFKNTRSFRGFSNGVSLAVARLHFLMI